MPFNKATASHPIYVPGSVWTGFNFCMAAINASVFPWQGLPLTVPLRPAWDSSNGVQDWSGQVGGTLRPGILGTNWQSRLSCLTLHLGWNDPDPLAGGQLPQRRWESTGSPAETMLFRGTFLECGDAREKKLYWENPPFFPPKFLISQPRDVMFCFCFLFCFYSRISQKPRNVFSQNLVDRLDLSHETVSSNLGFLPWDQYYFLAILMKIIEIKTRLQKCHRCHLSLWVFLWVCLSLPLVQFSSNFTPVHWCEMQTYLPPKHAHSANSYRKPQSFI